jgi:serine phosphatase RsbU (regulator of sigma subunit)
MDMVVCKVDREENLLQFAGANNPLYLIRAGELLEYKTDKMPVAVHDIMQPFRGQQIPLHTGDQVYIFSDGFADQFGGPRRKKFKYRPFKELLLSNSEKAMAEQGLLLDQAFERWMGDVEQIDDVLVIGLKF